MIKEIYVIIININPSNLHKINNVENIIIFLRSLFINESKKYMKIVRYKIVSIPEVIYAKKIGLKLINDRKIKIFFFGKLLLKYSKICIAPLSVKKTNKMFMTLANVGV